MNRLLVACSSVWPMGERDAGILIFEFSGFNGKSQLTGKDSDAGKDSRWEEKGATEDEMFGWRH